MGFLNKLARGLTPNNQNLVSLKKMYEDLKFVKSTGIKLPDRLFEAASRIETWVQKNPQRQSCAKYLLEALKAEHSNPFEPVKTISLTAYLTGKISPNTFNEIPDIFNCFPQLEEIILNDLKINSLPPSILSCEHLKTIEASGNEITTVPENLCSSLKKLDHLDLSDNKIEIIPKTVYAHFVEVKDSGSRTLKLGRLSQQQGNEGLNRRNPLNYAFAQLVTSHLQKKLEDIAIIGTTNPFNDDLSTEINVEKTPVTSYSDLSVNKDIQKIHLGFAEFFRILRFINDHPVLQYHLGESGVTAALLTSMETMLRQAYQPPTEAYGAQGAIRITIDQQNPENEIDRLGTAAGKAGEFLEECLISNQARMQEQLNASLIRV